jgi:hypothetical protein
MQLQYYRSLSRWTRPVGIWLPAALDDEQFLSGWQPTIGRHIERERLNERAQIHLVEPRHSFNSKPDIANEHPGQRRFSCHGYADTRSASAS